MAGTVPNDSALSACPPKTANAAASTGNIGHDDDACQLERLTNDR
ncbi:hypothetical protein PQR53_24860 [Paraburkholderia fungorum]